MAEVGGEVVRGANEGNPNSKDHRDMMDPEIQLLYDQGLFRIGKTCSGCLLYSSLLRSFTDQPVCIGYSRPSSVPGKHYKKPEKDVAKGFNFIHVYVGHSLCPEEMQHQREIPLVIAGFGGSYSRPKVNNANSDGSFSRFRRNANVLASRVSKNVRNAGNQIKERIDDILHPYRRPPK